MKIVVAIDSFKGSLSSIEAGNICADAAKKQFPDSMVKVYPLADGGEGTVDTMVEGLQGECVSVEVTGPLGEKVSSRYGYIPSMNTAVIEMADAAGLPMVPMELRNPMNTTTYGLGELILRALDNGCRRFIIGIGGSATNDAGIGMLSALGAKFFKENGEPAGITGSAVSEIASIDLGGMDSRLQECDIRVACDVNNPLCGENGCSHVYGPQKGATPEIVELMDKAIGKFATLVEKQCSITGADEAGAGAAGGLGYAFHGFLNAKLEKGIDLVLQAIGIEEDLRDADVLITGEGRMDIQTSMGKAPVGIAKLAKRMNPKCVTIGVCGCATPEAVAVNNEGIDAYFPILQTICTLEEALSPDAASRNLSSTAVQIMRLYGMR